MEALLRVPVNLAAALAVIAAAWDDGPRSKDNDFGMQFAVMAVRVLGWSVCLLAHFMLQSTRIM